MRQSVRVVVMLDNVQVDRAGEQPERFTMSENEKQPDDPGFVSNDLLSDVQWARLIRKVIEKRLEREVFEEAAEKEYERRFGVSPREADDDYWIDTLEFSNGVDIKAIIEHGSRRSVR